MSQFVSFLFHYYIYVYMYEEIISASSIFYDEAACPYIILVKLRQDGRLFIQLDEGKQLLGVCDYYQTD